MLGLVLVWGKNVDSQPETSRMTDRMVAMLHLKDEDKSDLSQTGVVLLAFRQTQQIRCLHR